MNIKGCIRIYADIGQINNCRELVQNTKEPVQFLASAMNLAGNEVRLNILYLLNKEQKLCVCDLSDILDMTIPAISQHLRKMKDGGLLSFDKIGQTVFYFLKPEYRELFSAFFKRIERNSVKHEVI